jgi:hypothetical protein
MTAGIRKYRASNHGRQKNWPKRRAPIARLRRASRATPKCPRGGLTRMRVSKPAASSASSNGPGASGGSRGSR